MHGKNTIAPEARGGAGSTGAPPPVIGKSFPDSPYTRLLARYPALSLAVSMLVPILITIIALGLRTSIDVRTEGFTAENTGAFKNMEAVELAEAYWQFLLAQSEQTLTSRLDTSRVRHNPQFRITLNFVLACSSGSTGCDNILTDSRLSFIKQVEDAATSGVTGFAGVCWQNNFRSGIELALSPGCAPVNSLTQYVFPTVLTQVPFFRLDGEGEQQQQMNAAMRERMLVNPNIDWYTDANFRSNGRTRVLRSQIILGTPISSRFSDKQTRDAVDEYVRRMFGAVMAAASADPDIVVSVGGDRVVEARVLGAMEDEAWKAPVGAVIIAVVLFVHSRSVVVSALGLIQILFTYLCTVSIFALNRDGELPLLSFVSLFFTIVWCVDGVLVVYDNFIYSGVMATTGRRNTLRVSQRMAFVMRKSIKGILTAHLCALVAFSINTMSPVEELREFAVLMIVMMVVSAYFFIFYAPSAVLFHHFYFSRRRRTLQRQKEIMMRDGVIERNPGMTALLEELEGLKSVTGQTPYSEIAEVHEERRKGNKKRRSDLINKTTALTNGSFITEWNVTFRKMNEAAEVRRMRNREAAAEQAEAADAAAFGGTPERRRRGSATSDHSDRSPEGDGGEDADAAPVMRIESRNFSAPEQQATLDDFANVDEAEAEGEDAKPPAPVYASMRHIPLAAVTHIPPELLYRNPENVDFARRLVTARLQPAAGAPAPEAPGAERPQRLGHGGDDDIEELMLDDDGNVMRADDARDAAPAAINMPVLRDQDMADDAPGRSQDPLLRLEEKVAPFNAAWADIAAELMILPGESPMAELTGILAYRTVAGLVGSALNDDNIVTRYDSPQQIGARIARAGFIDVDGRTQQVAGASAAPEAEDHMVEVGCGPCSKLSNVRRRWCCGRWGKRVDETSEERDARIMKKKVKHEGYGRAERFFFNGFSTGLHKMRRVVVLVFFVFLGLAIWGATTLETVDARVQLLADASNEEAFGVHEELFAIPPTSPCDFCGAAYRDPTEYRPQTFTSYTQCERQGFGALGLNGLLDQCDVCFGTNACLDCRGIPNGPNFIDRCGQCLTTNDTRRDSCLTCEGDPARRTPDCQFCARAGGEQAGGPNCQTACNTTNCPADFGQCNRYTGKCECHASRDLGFFATAPGDVVQCSRCVAGLGPGPTGSNTDVMCRKDCVFGQATNSDACGTCSLNGFCSGCPNGTLGSSCTIQDPDICENGVYDAATDVCTCHAGFSGPRCAGATVCSGRGLYLPATESVVETCDCRGAWAGKFCTYCRCKNGGTCTEEGTCTCPPGWSGPTCSSCAPSCTAHGNCPEPLRASQYEPLPCMGAFCSTEDLIADRVCSVCHRSEVGPCLAYEPPYMTRSDRDTICAADYKCFWNTTVGACFQRRNLTDVVTDSQRICRSCAGYWEGDACDQCAQPVGTNGCNAAGAVTACDGRVYLPGDAIPVVDLCGVCGGGNACVGCDGVIASNGAPKVIDRCGVCGGDGVCSDENSPFELTIAMGIFPEFLVTPTTYIYGLSGIDLHDWMDPVTQARIDDICSQIAEQRTGDNTRAELISCPMRSLRQFTEDPERNQRLNRTGGASGFPIREGDLVYRNRIMFNFLRETSSLSDVGFSTGDPQAANFTPVFMKIRARALAQHNGDSNTLLFLARRFDVLAESITAVSGIFTMQVSQRWIEATTEIQSRRGMAWASGIGFAVFLMLVHVLTCSLTSTIIAGLAVGFTAVVSLAVFAAFDFQLGAVEQISVSLLIGLAAEHTIHFVDTYLDTVQSTSSQLFARDVSRLAAMRVAMAQSATPIVASAIATIVVACLYLSSEVQPFRRASQITVVVVLVSLVTSLLAVGSFLVMVGPTTTFRIITIAVTILLHWIAIWGVAVFVLWLTQARVPDGSLAIG